MDALQQKDGKLQVLLVLWEDYDLLSVYGAYEVLIACPERFIVSTVGATSHVSTLGAPDCVVDYCCNDNDNDDAGGVVVVPRPDILIIPDGNFSSSASCIMGNKNDDILDNDSSSSSSSQSAALEAWVKKLYKSEEEKNDTIVLRIGPGALSEPVVLPSFLQEILQQEGEDENDNNNNKVFKSKSGADLAVYLVSQLAGDTARKKAEEYIEYRGQDPFVKHLPTADDDYSHFNHPGFHSSGKQNTTRSSTIRLGIFIFDGFEMLDTFGPMAAFVAAQRIYQEKYPREAAKVPLFEFTFYSEQSMVQSSRGPLFQTDQLLFDNNDNDDLEVVVDWLLIPGGIGTITENYNPVGLEWTRSIVKHAKCVLTVCTGSGYLAKLGLLDGYKATSNKQLYELMVSWGPKVDWQPQARWVQDDKFWTSSGVSAGIDQALAILETMFGSSDLADLAAYQIGWNHHRVRINSDIDSFAPKHMSRFEIMISNGMFSILLNWLPKSWRPSPATLDKFLTPLL